ncbi:hypothetical protein ACHGLA_35110 [Streptomyces sp. YH02]|uniref:hypothetical protein n=1 Tax=Streptomyces sp. YH02 TaxID=3256999 RepID=UPI003757F795
MDEIRAALASSMLDRLPERLAWHRRTYDALTGALGIPLPLHLTDHDRTDLLRALEKVHAGRPQRLRPRART